MRLCALPTCRIRGRHLPTCEADERHPCSGCLPRVADDGLVCATCERRAEEHLRNIVRLTPDARLVAAGLVRRGTGGGSGKPGSQSPGNDGAMDAMDAVQSALTTLARDIAETRGITIPNGVAR